MYIYKHKHAHAHSKHATLAALQTPCSRLHFPLLPVVLMNKESSFSIAHTTFQRTQNYTHAHTHIHIHTHTPKQAHTCTHAHARTPPLQLPFQTPCPHPHPPLPSLRFRGAPSQHSRLLPAAAVLASRVHCALCILGRRGAAQTVDEAHDMDAAAGEFVCVVCVVCFACVYILGKRGAAQGGDGALMIWTLQLVSWCVLCVCVCWCVVCVCVVCVCVCARVWCVCMCVCVCVCVCLRLCCVCTCPLGKNRGVALQCA